MTPGLLARATGGRRRNHTLGWGRGERRRGENRSSVLAPLSLRGLLDAERGYGGC